MCDVVRWFNEAYEDQKDNTAENSFHNNEISMEMENPISSNKRCIVLTVCISETILNLTNTGSIDALQSLEEAILAFHQKLRQDDFVLYNIGNSSKGFLVDKQLNVKSWQQTMRECSQIKEYVQARESSKFADSFAQVVMGNKN